MHDVFVASAHVVAAPHMKVSPAGSGGSGGDGGGMGGGGGAGSPGGGGAAGAQAASLSARPKHAAAPSKEVASAPHATQALPLHAVPARQSLTEAAAGA